MKNTYIICFDVGGNTIKSAVLNNEGELVCQIQNFPSMAVCSKDIILQNFAHIFEVLLGYIPDKENIRGDLFCFSGRI